MMILITLTLMSCNNQQPPKIDDGKYNVTHDSGQVYGYIDTEVDEIIITNEFFCFRWLNYDEEYDKDYYYCFLWDEIELERVGS